MFTFERWGTCDSRSIDRTLFQGGPMTIRRMLQNTPMGPEDIARLVAAYEQALSELSLKDRNDPLTELVAKKIIEVAQTGVRDPAQIARLAIKELGLP
jgi:hypothetical protein